tara:strand:+ start:1394 stop:2881 length:1488 start_codon:yes stop_codon:yes gene_type:complete
LVGPGPQVRNPLHDLSKAVQIALLMMDELQPIINGQTLLPDLYNGAPSTLPLDVNNETRHAMLTNEIRNRSNTSDQNTGHVMLAIEVTRMMGLLHPNEGKLDLETATYIPERSNLLREINDVNLLFDQYDRLITLGAQPVDFLGHWYLPDVRTLADLRTGPGQPLVLTAQILQHVQQPQQVQADILAPADAAANNIVAVVPPPAAAPPLIPVPIAIPAADPVVEVAAVAVDNAAVADGAVADGAVADGVAPAIEIPTPPDLPDLPPPSLNVALTPGRHRFPTQQYPQQHQQHQPHFQQYQPYPIQQQQQQHQLQQYMPQGPLYYQPHMSQHMPQQMQQMPFYQQQLIQQQMEQMRQQQMQQMQQIQQQQQQMQQMQQMRQQQQQMQQMRQQQQDMQHNSNRNQHHVGMSGGYYSSSSSSSSSNNNYNSFSSNNNNYNRSNQSYQSGQAYNQEYHGGRHPQRRSHWHDDRSNNPQRRSPTRYNKREKQYRTQDGRR